MLNEFSISSLVNNVLSRLCEMVLASVYISCDWCNFSVVILEIQTITSQAFQSYVRVVRSYVVVSGIVLGPELSSVVVAGISEFVCKKVAVSSALTLLVCVPCDRPNTKQCSCPSPHQPPEDQSDS